MIKQYLNFTKNGINSRDMGVLHVSIDSGMYTESLGGNRTIQEQQNSETDRRYFKRLSTEPIEFDMHVLLYEEMDEYQIDEVLSWLMNDYYEEMFFEDEVDKIYYCLPISKPTVTHNGMNQGYITIQMRCFDGFLYSQEIKRTFDLSNNVADGTTVSLVNDGHFEVYPKMTILAKESTIKVINLKTNESTEITDLLIGETVNLDNENEEISTDVVGEYRFDNHNEVFVRILKSVNQFKVIGKCVITFEYRYRRKF